MRAFLTFMRSTWKKIFSWLPAPCVVPTLVKLPVRRQERPSDEKVTASLTLFQEKIHSLYSERGWWSTIPRVVVTTRFGGCAYVEGATTGICVDSRLTIVLHDDCMSFTSVCVLIDGTPSIILESNCGRFTVYLIEGQDYLKEVLGEGLMKCDSLKEFRALPEPLQMVLERVFLDIYKRESQKPEKVSATEKILDYAGF